MVGEFPELQGIMGGYYARAEGLPDAVADAIRDHYKPVGQGDDVPTAPVTVAVSLADKLDSLAGFFGRAMPPTGSKDPFALRRAALGVVSLIQVNGLRLPLDRVFREAQFWLAESEEGLRISLGDLADFMTERLKVQQREAGVRHDLIDAVFALGGEDDLVRLLARVTALQAFVETPDGANLLAGYKRAANILKKEGGASTPVTPAQAGVSGEDAPSVPEMPASAGMTGENYTPEPAESALIAALDAAEPLAAAAVQAEDFAGAMRALATLRAPVDAFFDAVMVNDPDPAKRAARLALLARMRDAVHTVADFSQIAG
jgi:glycyl-tRNA synthetase beta chain